MTKIEKRQMSLFRDLNDILVTTRPLEIYKPHKIYGIESSLKQSITARRRIPL